MQPRAFLTILALFSVGCGANAPKVTVCVSNPANNGMDCYNKKTETVSFKDFKETENFVCLPPSDLQVILTYCKQLK